MPVLPAISSPEVLDQVGDSVLITDSAGVIVFVNKAFEALTGYAAEEVIGKTPSILSSGHHPAEVYADMWATITAGKAFRFIFVNKKKDGTIYHHGTNISPIRDACGEITHYFAMGRAIQESRQTYDAFLLLANASPIGSYIIQNGKFFFVNEQFCLHTGYSADEMIGKPWHSLMLEEDFADAKDKAFAMLRDERKAAYEYRIRAKDGSIHWLLETIKHATFFGMASVSGALAVGNFVDITDRKKTEQELNQTLSMYAATMDSTADGILVLSQEGSVSFNRRYQEMWNADAGKGFDNLLSQIKDPRGFKKRTYSLMANPLAEAKDSVELLDGRVYEVFSKPQLLDGVPIGRVWSHRDVTERKQFEAQLVHLANNDALTSLFNRRRLQEELEAGLATSALTDAKCALLLLDIDRFKEINDALGHHAGDDLLVRLAEVMTQTLGDDYTVGRFGGDEFAVFLRNGGREEAERAAAKLAEELRAQSSWDAGARLPLTVSIGIAVYPDHAANVDELCSHADLAMYDAKTSGRNRVAVYSPRLQQRVMRFPRDWRDRITSALEEERLELYEQPIIDPMDGSVTGHELLVRLLNTDGTVIPAKHFIPFAEQSGLIQGIDQWVMHAAMQLAQRLQAAGSREYLAFNLSRWAFVDPVMLEMLKCELAQTGVDPHLIVVEMTETSALSDINSAERFMHGLRASGCRFALDDFGVGYSSFHHLKRLPVDFLKIDGSFVRDITHNRADREIVSAMTKMAEGLGLQTVAEAVHSEQVLDIAREIGVHYAQGYHIARPAPAALLLSRTEGCKLQLSGDKPKREAPRKLQAA